MKKLFFLALPLLLVSCKGVEQYRAGIEELAGNWDSTTEALTQFSGMLSTDLSSYTNSFAAMQPDEAAMASLNPEQKAAIETSRDGVVEALKAYPTLQTSIKDFVNTWTEKSAVLTSLKDGLAAGKIEGDVTAQLSDLSTMVTTATENLDSWKGSHETIQATLRNALGKFSEAMAVVDPKPAM
jgi:hypothetical protein